MAQDVDENCQRKGNNVNESNNGDSHQVPKLQDEMGSVISIALKVVVIVLAVIGAIVVLGIVGMAVMYFGMMGGMHGMHGMWMGHMGGR